ncbi:Alpha/Beta hydrolase protein [Cladochytrium replicatum]|nr:Alpha/Beta hydrolase protein [Cladochytrium replicatum]
MSDTYSSRSSTRCCLTILLAMSVRRFKQIFIFLINSVCEPHSDQQRSQQETRFLTMSPTLHQEEVSFLSADGSTFLAGTLSFPQPGNPKYPAVLIIGDSGPLDRNGNTHQLPPIVEMMMGKQPTRMILSMVSFRLAEALAGLGIAALRFDKRGIAKSEGEGKQSAYFEAGILENAQDAVGAYELLLRHPAIDNNRIFIAGHGEGSILIPRILRLIHEDKRNFPGVFGAVFLTGFGESVSSATAHARSTIAQTAASGGGVGGWIVRHAIGGKTKEEIQQNMDKQASANFDLIRQSDEDFKKIAFGFYKAPVKWWRDHLNYEIPGQLEEDYKNYVDCHVLAIAGEYDGQFGSSHVDKPLGLVPKAKSIRAEVIPHMTHYLRHAKKPLNPMQVLWDDLPLHLAKPFAPEILSLLGQWFPGTMNSK